MRGLNLNPERREKDKYERATIFDNDFITNLSPQTTRRRNDQQRQHRPRAPPEILTPQQKPQRTRRRGRVTLGSRPLTQPIPLIIPPQESLNSLASTAVSLDHNNSGTLRPWEVPGENSGNCFPGPALPAPNSGIYHQQEHYLQQHARSHPSHTAPSDVGAGPWNNRSQTLQSWEAPGENSGNGPLGQALPALNSVVHHQELARSQPSQTTPSYINPSPWHMESPAPNTPRNSLSFAGPINLGQREHTTPDHRFQPAVSLSPSRPGFSVTGPTGNPEPCEVTIDYQLDISVISITLARHLECILLPGNPSWSNWTVQTPVGLFNPEVWVQDISIESQWSQFRIPPKTASFVVVDHCWTGTSIILGKPILQNLLQANAVA